jgi:hypothetical protein
MYLDIDRKNRRFMIKDSITQDVIYKIPEWLMSCDSHEDYLDVAHRFIWIDNDTIRIINNEGIERLIDLRNNFREI